MKKLKCWNGRGLGKFSRHHLYVAAYSQKHAIELLTKANDGIPYCGLYEIQKYWANCWGTKMETVFGTPYGPGVWADSEEWSYVTGIRRVV